MFIAVGQLSALIKVNTSFSDLVYLFAAGLGILVVWLFYHQDRQIWFFKCHHFIRKYLIGWLLGGLIFTVAWLISYLLGGFRVTHTFSLGASIYIFLFLVGFAIQGMEEEIIFRGFSFGFLNRDFNVFWSTILSATIFVSMHSLNNGFNMLAISQLYLFAIIMTILRLSTNSLWLSGGFHAAWNFFEGIVFGTSVSGMNMHYTVFKSVAISGKELWAGGHFGLEASFSVVIVQTIFLILLLAWRRVRVTS